MAVNSAILIPSSAASIKVAALATGTASSEQSLGNNTIFAINADQDIGIKFGITGMAAASATSMRIPANQTFTYDMGREFTHIRVFNMSGTTAANIYVQVLSKF